MSILDDLFAAFAEVVPPEPPKRLADLNLRPGRTEELRRALRNQARAAPGDDPNHSRLPWPEDWFDRRSPLDVRACQTMWATALIENVRQLLKAAAKDGARVSDTWIRSNDFAMMCNFAGIDPGAASSAVAAALADPTRRARLHAALSSRGFHEEAP